MNNERLLKLLDDEYIVQAGLNKMATDNSVATVKLRMTLLREKFRIKQELSFYNDDEIAEARGKIEHTQEPVYVEEEEVKRVEERGGLYYMLLVFILSSDSKNKAFLLIALELFCKDEKLIKTYKKVKV
jgi:hypothetical protein